MTALAAEKLGNCAGDLHHITSLLSLRLDREAAPLYIGGWPLLVRSSADSTAGVISVKARSMLFRSSAYIVCYLWNEQRTLCSAKTGTLGLGAMYCWPQLRTQTPQTIMTNGLHHRRCNRHRNNRNNKIIATL